MTMWRRDEHSSPFGLWLRRQSKIDSQLGFITTDIDYIWYNYKTNEWMLIEEKRYNTFPSRPQLTCLNQINRYLEASKLYRGCYIVVFENDSPDNGLINVGKLNTNDAFPETSTKYKTMTKDTFLSFLRFEYSF